MSWSSSSRLTGLTKAANALAVGCALVALSAGSFGQIPCSYSVSIVPPVDCGFGPYAGNPQAMNNLGHVIATFISCGEPYDLTYLWTGGPNVQVLPVPPGGLGFAAADISDNGLVVGTAQMTGLGFRAYIYDTNTGQWTQLPPVNPSVGWSNATAVTSDGSTVVGFRSLDDGGDPIDPFNAFIWSKSFDDLGVMVGPRSAARAINSNGVVCGWTGTSQINGQAFIHSSGKTTLLGPIPGGFSSAGFGLNTQADVVGSGRIVVRGATLTWPFVHADGQMIILPTLEGFPRGSAADIDDNRLIVGVCTQQQNPSETIGCVWRDEAVIALDSLIDRDLNIEVTSAGDITATGQILCEGRQSGEGVILVLTPRKRVSGDATCDEQVNVDDLLAVINQWGACFSCGTDFDLTGVVDFIDLQTVIDNWSFD